MAGWYFADSFYWIALVYPRDAWHARALAWQQANPHACYVTTEEVLGEVLTWFAAKGLSWRAIAVQAVGGVIRNPNAQVLPQSSASFHEAMTFFASRPDKEYILVDCRSMAAMKSLGLSEVLSNDHHFTQEGFTVLFP